MYITHTSHYHYTCCWSVHTHTHYLISGSHTHTCHTLLHTTHTVTTLHTHTCYTHTHTFIIIIIILILLHCISFQQLPSLL